MGKTCWFGAFLPSMHATIILYPLDVDENTWCDIYVQLKSKINTYLQECGTVSKDITYT